MGNWIFFLKKPKLNARPVHFTIGLLTTNDFQSHAAFLEVVSRIAGTYPAACSEKLPAVAR